MAENTGDPRSSTADRWWELVQKAYEYTKDYGASTIRTLILVNGGAVVSILAAIANIVSKNESIATKLAERLTPSLAFFLGGMTFALLAGCSAFFNFYISAAALPGPAKLHDFVITGDMSGWKDRTRAIDRTMYIAVTFVFLSLGCFVVGAVCAIYAFGGSLTAGIPACTTFNSNDVIH
jgi:hypothetical protein